MGRQIFSLNSSAYDCRRYSVIHVNVAIGRYVLEVAAMGRLAGSVGKKERKSLLTPGFSGGFQPIASRY